LKSIVEALLSEDKEVSSLADQTTTVKPYSIKYVDADNEEINISDDEDLSTAYYIAQKDLNGSLKFVISLKENAS
jgi:hypothetical protein